MARSQAWKNLERQAAGAFPGGVRVTKKGESAPDVIGDGWLAECKLRKSFLHHRLFREEKAKRRADLRRGTRRFVLVTRESGKEALAILSLADFAALMEELSERKEGPGPHQGQGLTLPGR